MALKGKIKRASALLPRTRLVEPPLVRMKRAGSLNVYELTAADEIVAAYRLSIGEQPSRDPDLYSPSTDVRVDAADSAAAKRSDILAKYGQLLRDLRGSAPLAAVIGVLIEERAMREVERLQQWRSGTAKTHLMIGIRHFAALRGNTPNSVRGWKVETCKLRPAP